jgi:hypothetical protein
MAGEKVFAERPQINNLTVVTGRAGYRINPVNISLHHSGLPVGRQYRQPVTDTLVQ